MGRVLDDDSGLGDILEGLGHTRVTDVERVREVDLIVMGPRWTRLRGWRFGGVQVPALVNLAGTPAPEDRASFEPVAWVDGPSHARVQRALETLAARGEALRLDLGDGVVVDLPRRRLVIGGRDVPLSQREVDLLAYLGARAEREVSREELLTEVWGHARASATRSVDMAIYRLRRKLEPEPSSPRYLLSSYAGGYRLSVPSERPEALLGRGALISSVVDALASHRLVCLTGPPGIGKSRVAAAVAMAVPGREVFAAGLAAARDGADAFAEVAAQLDIATAAGGPTDEAVATLCRQLTSAGPALLVLDDADHADGWVDQLVEVSAALPLHVLTTRQASGPSGLAIPVPPLDPEAARTLLLQGCPEADDSDVDALLELLDGLPLALELAGAQLAHLPPRALVARASTLPALLADPEVTDRHRAVEVALAWSWERLSPVEREVLARVSTFESAVSLDDVEQVCERPDALVHAARLLAAGWLRGDGTRVRLLHTVRAWLRQHLEPASLEEAAAAHRRWAVARGRALVDVARTDRAAEHVEILAPHRADLAAAWGSAEDPAALAVLTRALDGIDGRYGTFDGRITRLDAALGRIGDEAVALPLRLERVRLLAYRDLAGSPPRVDEVADAALRHGALGMSWRARALAADHLRWSRGPRAALAHLEGGAGPPEHDDSADALVHRARRLALRAECGELAPDVAGRRLAGLTEHLLDAGAHADALQVGRIASFWIEKGGDVAWALRLHRRLVRLAARCGDGRVELILKAGLAFTARSANAFDDALDMLDQATALAEQREPARVQMLRHYRGSLLVHLGRLDEAEAELTRSLDWLRATDRPGESARVWLVSSTLHALRGRLEEASRCVASGLTDADRADDASARAMLHSQLALLHHLAGDLSAAGAVWEELDEPALPLFRCEWAARRLALEVARGRSTDALAVVLERTARTLPGVVDARHYREVGGALHRGEPLPELEGAVSADLRLLVAAVPESGSGR